MAEQSVEQSDKQSTEFTLKDFGGIFENVISYEKEEKEKSIDRDVVQSEAIEKYKQCEKVAVAWMTIMKTDILDFANSPTLDALNGLLNNDLFAVFKLKDFKLIEKLCNIFPKIKERTMTKFYLFGIFDDCRAVSCDLDPTCLYENVDLEMFEQLSDFFELNGDNDVYHFKVHMFYESMLRYQFFNRRICDFIASKIGLTLGDIIRLTFHALDGKFQHTYLPRLLKNYKTEMYNLETVNKYILERFKVIYNAREKVCSTLPKEIKADYIRDVYEPLAEILAKYE